MPAGFSEKGLVEKPTLELLGTLGYETIDAYTEAFGPDSPASSNPGRDDRSQVILSLNPPLGDG